MYSTLHIVAEHNVLVSHRNSALLNLIEAINIDDGRASDGSVYYNSIEVSQISKKITLACPTLVSVVYL